MALSKVTTSAGDISIWDSQGDGPAVLLIHGNSACKEVFKKQMEGLGKKYRFIAMDLPGHGKSDNAKDPKATYHLNGYADIAVEVLEKLGIQHASVFGWSLGGHIAIQMLQRWQGTKAVFISGTPPIELSKEGFGKGFLPTCNCLHLLSQEHFTRDEAETFVGQGGLDPKKPENQFLVEATLRTDGRARSHMIAEIVKGGNQKEIVETTNKPVAVVHGRGDTGINLDYLEKEIDKTALWDRKVHILETGHATFWDKPEAFNAILDRFLTDVERQEAAARNVRRAVVQSFGLLALAGLALSFFRSRS